MLAGLLARRLGASEVAVGVWAALSTPAVFAALIAMWARSEAGSRWRTTTIAAATYAASAAVAIGSILPGFELAAATLRTPGDELPVTFPRGGTARIAVFGSAPREGPGYVPFELRAGRERLLGSVERTTSHIRIAGTEQHRRREHGAQAYDVPLPPGRSRIVLEKLGGELVDGLHVSVFEPILPACVAATLAIVTLLVVSWVLGNGSAERVAMAAGASIAFGFALGAMATPHAALRPAFLALVATPLGMIAGSLAHGAAQRIKRRIRGVRVRSGRAARR